LPGTEVSNVGSGHVHSAVALTQDDEEPRYLRPATSLDGRLPYASFPQTVLRHAIRGLLYHSNVGSGHVHSAVALTQDDEEQHHHNEGDEGGD
jgi:hypothetical protein